MGSIKAFLAGLGAFLSAVSRWWEARQREEARAQAQLEADRIAADPASEWLRKFKHQANPPSGPDAGKPGGDE